MRATAFPARPAFAKRLGPVLRFAPTRADSARFNPLFEVRRGANEVRDVQNIVEILVDPAGDGRHQDFWDRSAKHVLVGVILHVLYAEPPERKTLAVRAREAARSRRDRARDEVGYHRISPTTGAPEVHPEVLHAAESFLAGEERMQSGIKATAESFFGLFADEIVARKTATSDFRIGDLMCGDAPVTLYLQPPPSDALRLMPLMRLIINQIARALMEHQTHDAQGRPKRHRLLLVLDEFPMLGRMPFFETMMGAMAGYGLKAFLVCQSSITSPTPMAATMSFSTIATSSRRSPPPTTTPPSASPTWRAKSGSCAKATRSTRPRPILGWAHGSTTLREERRPLLSAARDVRALPRDEQLIFVSGAKPIRAKKLNFDQEQVFRRALASCSGARPTLDASRMIGQTCARSAFMPTAGAVADAPSPPWPRRLKAQPDLFAQAAMQAARSPSSRSPASAGRTAQSCRLRRAATQATAPAGSAAPRAEEPPRRVTLEGDLSHGRAQASPSICRRARRAHRGASPRNSIARNRALSPRRVKARFDTRRARQRRTKNASAAALARRCAARQGDRRERSS